MSDMGVDMLYGAGLLENFGVKVNRPMFLNTDNSAAVDFATAQTMFRKCKVIDRRYHWIREHVLNGDFKVRLVKGENQIADMFTKPMPLVRLEMFQSRINLIRRRRNSY